MDHWEYATMARTWATGEGIGDIAEFSNGLIVFSHSSERIEFKYDDLMSVLRRLGDEGWEMVGFGRSVVGTFQLNVVAQDAFFKRLVPSALRED